MDKSDISLHVVGTMKSTGQPLSWGGATGFWLNYQTLKSITYIYRFISSRFSILEIPILPSNHLGPLPVLFFPMYLVYGWSYFWLHNLQQKNFNIDKISFISLKLIITKFSLIYLHYRIISLSRDKTGPLVNPILHGRLRQLIYPWVSGFSSYLIYSLRF